MRRAMKALIMTGALALVLAPTPAKADGFVTPWIGTAFGSNYKNGQTTFGVSAGGMGAGIFGAEVDFGDSPSFFGNKSDFGSNTVMTLMGNAILGIPVGGTRGPGVRPYIVGGVGLVRTQIDGGSLVQVSTSDNQFGWDLGAGVMGYFGQHVGLRGDVRYLRSFQNSNNGITTVDFNGNGQLHFWRASIGVLFR
jgi:hypothetical protein